MISLKPLKPLAAAICFIVPSVYADESSTQVYWGDTHLHSNVSPDAFLFGNRTVTPDQAYRFAKGMPVVNAGNQGRFQLRRPLDFLVIADHAELMGVPLRITQGNQALINTDFGGDMFELIKAGEGEKAFIKFLGLLNRGESIPEFEADDIRQPIWNRLADTADRHNTPHQFTALIGWEWSSLPEGGNLHRVVFTDESAEVAKQFIPFSSNDSNRPESLWDWLDKTSTELNARFVAIPHNSNISDGRMFALEDSEGRPLSAAYGSQRMKWEPVVEATQIKGDSETIGKLSPDDEFADFESYRHLIKQDMNGDNPEPTEADYVRSGLKRGLDVESRVGVNPFKFGLIGSTDAHTGLATAEEDNFAGKFPFGVLPGRNKDPLAGSSITGWDMSASGLAAVWATENTRASIMDAFKRREVYSSTGPRMTLRVFAGYDFEGQDAEARDLAAVGYKKGVPMGSDMAPLTDSEKLSPRLLIRANKDPEGAGLDRVQVVKGWIDDDGKTLERVFDVSWAGDRKLRNGKLASIGDTVNRKTGKLDRDLGAAQLSVVWTDPSFDPDQRSFYYVRVLQVPTARHSTLDMLALGQDPEAQSKYPVTIQERAYSSPIWYTPRQ
ncbi:MAG: DUF3604 domain-containing protein [Cellvibrionaceae bacterium]